MSKGKLKVTGILFLLLLYIQCKEKSPVIKENPVKEEVVFPSEKKDTIKKVPHYYLQVKNEETIKWIQSILSEDSLKIIKALNRVEKRYLFQLDTIIIPDTFAVDLNYFSPFPAAVKVLDSVHKIIIYSYPLQAFAAYESGKLIRWGPVSMGKKSTPTPTGLFHTNWKSKQTISTVNEEWIMNWYFNLDNFDGVSMHEYNLPGYPASHSCIRLLTEDASWFYHWADQWILSGNTIIIAYGTPVIVYGTYPFTGSKPWRAIKPNGEGIYITEEMLEKEIIDFLPLITERQAIRDTVNLPREDVKSQSGSPI
jgi:L,D-transpeptidase catalytic domain